jgi:hypothetical protein
VETVGAGSGDGKAIEKAEKGKIENGYRAAVSYLREVGEVGIHCKPLPPIHSSGDN